MQTTRALSNPLFSVNFCGREYQVDHILHKRPIAIVLAVSRNGQRYVIKVYPKREEPKYYGAGYANERRAYQIFRSSNCTAVPTYLGSTSSLTASYTEKTAIPRHERLLGKQKAIILEFLDAEMITFEKLTRSVAKMALEALEQIHKLSICHGDICEYGWDLFRNVMLMNNGEVKWIDFEHSWVDSGDEITFEMEVALSMWGPNGCVWNNRMLDDTRASTQQVDYRR